MANQFGQSTIYGPNTLESLSSLNWDFDQSVTGSLTHGFHPYPAKFIPEIPATLVRYLSLEGGTILDPFCGSGTSLVEAVAAGRNAIGIDSNPLAALIAKVKATALPRAAVVAAEDCLMEVALAAFKRDRGPYAQLPLAPDLALREDDLERKLRSYPVLGSNIEYVFFWFPTQSVSELLFLRERIDTVSNIAARSLLQVALSAIVVSVSLQDSETRYVRRAKRLRAGDCLRKWLAKAQEMLARIAEVGATLSRARVDVYSADAREMDFLPSECANLCISSPPYPNAFTYNLYHRLRMVWLDIDPIRVKQVEIGSHRDYSRRTNGSTRETFAQDMKRALKQVHRILKPNSHCAFVIGDSIVRGEKVDNSGIVADVAGSVGFAVSGRVIRNIRLTKKALNPTFGKIKTEHLVILRKP